MKNTLALSLLVAIATSAVVEAGQRMTKDDGADFTYEMIGIKPNLRKLIIENSTEAGNETVAPTGAPTRAPESLRNISLVSIFGASGLDVCEGICRWDSDCINGLVCYRRYHGGDVPFCQFGDDAVKQSKYFLDFCTFPPTASPTQTPSSMPSDIPSSLPSGAPSMNPTIAPTTLVPSESPTSAPTTLAPTPWPTPGSPKDVAVRFLGNPIPKDLELEKCQGDCDTDRDCAGNFECRGRNSGDKVEGCRFTAEVGASIEDDTDICVDRRLFSNQFRLKLYWQFGYYWQEETKERKWCMEHSMKGSSCWYGLEERPCVSDEIYVEKCGSSSNQVFEFLYQPSGEVLILAVSANKCLEGNRPRLRDCDPKNGEQLWHPMNGGYDSKSFELTRKRWGSKCLSQAHHPKAGEVIELSDCARERTYTTNAWELYW